MGNGETLPLLNVRAEVGRVGDYQAAADAAVAIGCHAPRPAKCQDIPLIESTEIEAGASRGFPNWG